MLARRDADINTVSKLLVEAGKACAAFHDANVHDVKAKRVQVDEIWTFVYAKEKNVAGAEAAPDGTGDMSPTTPGLRRSAAPTRSGGKADT